MRAVINAAGIQMDAESIDGEIRSTTYADRLLVTARRGLDRLPGPLEIASFQLSWDTERLIQGQASIVVADPEGGLEPITIADPLAPGGSRLDIVYEFGATDTRVLLDTWRIRRVTPRIDLQWRRLSGNLVWLHGGGTIAVQADEELASVQLDRLDIGSRRPTHETVLAEVQYLVADYLTLAVHADVVDASLPAADMDDDEYGDDRLAVVADLLNLIGAAYRISSGTLEVVPAVGVPAGFVIDPGEDGCLVSAASTMTDDDLANAVTSHREWTDDDGVERELVGRARLVDGPLAYGGPFGKVTKFRGANLATTQQQVDSDAETALARLSRQGDVILSVTCLTNPALQLYDLVSLAMPVPGAVNEVTGKVVAMTLTATDGVVEKTMDLRLAVSHQQLARLRSLP